VRLRSRPTRSSPKSKKIAAHAPKAAEDDIEFSDAMFRVVGTDRSVSLQEVAQAACVPSRLPEGLETGLYEVASFSPEIPNFPNGCHVCEVEIDPETGATRVLLRYVVVDDVGTVINKLTLEGHIHGGVAQGIGHAFTEHLVYDEASGQLLSGSLRITACRAPTRSRPSKSTRTRCRPRRTHWGSSVPVRPAMSERSPRS
jgi:carbon-monoxide dehydrogenase large subunit